MVKLFTKVHCKAYMAKVHDTVRIQLFDEDGTLCTTKTVNSYKCKAIAYKFDPEKCEEIEIKDLSEFDGDSVEKIYRERKECEFDGVVVGYTRINVKGLIGTDWQSYDYGFGDLHEYGHCFKEITERVKVAVVYFKNNCKRYVLPEDMEGN